MSRGVEVNDFGVGGAIPGGHKEQVQVKTGQIGALQAMFCGRTIVAVTMDPSRTRGLILKFSDGSTIGLKCAHVPKTVELSFDQPVPGESTQPRRFNVTTG